MNPNWPRYNVTPSVSLSEIRRHAERRWQQTGTPQLIVHEDGSWEWVPEAEGS